MQNGMRFQSKGKKKGPGVDNPAVAKVTASIFK